MNSFETYNDIPWELVAAHLQGDISVEESARLQEWVLARPENGEQLVHLQSIWQEDINDYDLYLRADPGAGWASLSARIGAVGSSVQGAKVIKARFSGNTRRWMSAAAAIILIAGGAYWYFARTATATVYQTAANEQKKVSLPDGSTVVLHSGTRIGFSGDYNKEGRKVSLSEGEATFDVQHSEEQPFTVDMDKLSVKDLGTQFTVLKNTDSVKVTVFSGKVSFMNNASGEAHEIAAGGSLTYYTAQQQFGAVQSPVNLLQFDNIPLSDVVLALQNAYGKTVQLKDAAMGAKRFTARNMQGESFDNALKIICASLNLQYTVQNGVYLLSPADSSGAK